MRKLLIIIILLLPSLSNAQLNKYIWQSSAAQFVAGAADGANQAYLFHYSNSGKFEKWNIAPNSEAWKNKWAKDSAGNVIVGKERFWLSSRSLVFLTDFHHSSRFVENRATEASLLIYAIGHGVKRKRWYWYLADTAILFTVRSIGFYSTYNIVFK